MRSRTHRTGRSESDLRGRLDTCCDAVCERGALDKQAGGKRQRPVRRWREGHCPCGVWRQLVFSLGEKRRLTASRTQLRCILARCCPLFHRAESCQGRATDHFRPVSGATQWHRPRVAPGASRKHRGLGQRLSTVRHFTRLRCINSRARRLCHSAVLQSTVQSLRKQLRNSTAPIWLYIHIYTHIYIHRNSTVCASV